jgi:hypothetical protein
MKFILNFHSEMYVLQHFLVVSEMYLCYLTGRKICL